MEMMFTNMSELFETEYDKRIVEAQVQAWASITLEEQGSTCQGCMHCDEIYLLT